MAQQHCRAHVAHCLGSILARRGAATVAVDGSRRLTGAEFVDEVRRLAAALAARGVRPGDVVAVVAFNSIEFVELFLAVTYVGAVIAPLNYRWSFEEATQALELVQPSVFIFDDSHSSWAIWLTRNKTLPSATLYIVMGDSSSSIPVASLDHIKRTAKEPTSTEPVSAPNDVALICFTSGTTGRPKGVAISHASLIIQSLAKIAVVGYGEDDVYLHAAPLCHVGGVSSCLAVLMAGGCHVMILPKFDAKLALDAVREHGVTSFITVPAMMADLLSCAREERILSDCGMTVTKVLNGGGGLSDELIDGACQLFPRAVIFSAYGMTEACSSLTFMALNKPKLQEPKTQEQPVSYFGGGVCVGKPAPHVEIRIGADGNSNNSSRTGSILTRGLHTMVGYWVNSKVDSSDSSSRSGGWLNTGDTGWMDGSGNLWLVGRQKGRIKSGGENVYPEEVESVLSQHPGVAKVVVIGVPDSRLGEKVIACVSVKDGWKWVDTRPGNQGEGKVVSGWILQDHCRLKNLSRFKVPRSYYQWKRPFPVTSTGKIRREELKREILTNMQLPSNL